MASAQPAFRVQTIPRGPEPFKYLLTLEGSAGDFVGGQWQHVAPKESQLLVGQMNPLKIPCAIGDYLDVIIAVTESPEKIFVQLQNESASISDLSNKLQNKFGEMAPDKDIFINPKRGSVCAAKYSLDQNWYRAAVLERPDPQNVKVFFVDYGNVEIVPKLDIKKLPDELAQMPPQAIAVKMDNVTNTNRFPIEQLCEILESRPATLKITGTTGALYHCTMFVSVPNGPEVNMNDVVLGRAAPPPPMQPPEPTPPVRQPQSDGFGPRQGGFDRNTGGGFNQGGGGFADRTQGGFSQGGRAPPGPCRHCGDTGHWQRDCPTQSGGSGSGFSTGPPGGGSGRGCFNCGQDGHMSRECTEPRKERSGGGGRTCYKCGKEGHISRDCTEAGGGGGFGGQGGGRSCYNCGQEGHMSRDCTEPRKQGGGPRGPITCHICKEEGHKSFECPQKGGGSSGGFTSGGFGNQSGTSGGFNSGASGGFSSGFGKPAPSSGFGTGFNTGSSDSGGFKSSTSGGFSAKSDFNATPSPAPVVTKPIEPPAPPKPVILTESAIPTDDRVKVLRSDGEATSPSGFALTILAKGPLNEEIDTTIQPGTDVMTDLQVGKFGVAIFEGDWFRCKVVGVEGDTATILFVDYGNTESVPSSQLFTLSPSQPAGVRTHPQLSIACRLSCVSPIEDEEWSGEAKEWFAALCDDETNELSAKFGRKRGGVCVVELFVMQDGEEKGLGQKMVEEGFAMEVEEQPDPPVILAECEVPTDAVAVIRSDGELTSPGQFAVTLLTKTDMNNEIDMAIQPGTDPMEDIQVGKFGVAMFLDEWFRCRVIAVGSETVTIRFVDYGNVEHIPTSELFTLSPTQPACILTYPCISIPCQLSSTPTDSTWSDAAIDAFMALCDAEGQLLHCTFGEKQGDIYEVQLELVRGEERKSVGQELVNGGHAEGIKEERPAEEPEPTAPPAPPAAVADQALIKVTLAECPLPSEAVPVVRSDGEVTSPGLFALTLVQNDHLNEQIDTSIQPGTMPMAVVEVGRFGVAMFGQDWFRAKVVGLEGDTATLLFVDYGNVEQKPISEIYELTSVQPALVLTQHSLSTRCQLAGLTAPAEGWSEETSNAFKGICDADDLTAKFGDTVDDVRMVELFVGGESVAQMLTDAGQATAAAAMQNLGTESEATQESAEPAEADNADFDDELLNEIESELAEN